MALISCPECNKEISDKANACPHCGLPLEKEIFIEPKIEVIKTTTRSIGNPKKSKQCRKCNAVSGSGIFCASCFTLFPHTTHDELNSIKKVMRIIGWVAAPMLMLASIVNIKHNPILVSLIFLIALLSFQPSRKFIRQKIKFVPNAWITLILFFAAFIASPRLTDKNEQLEQEEKRAAAVENKRKSDSVTVSDFKKNGNSIISSISKLANEKKFKEAFDLLKKYEPAKSIDSKTSVIIDSMVLVVKSYEAREKTSELEKQLDSNPNMSKEDQLSIYEQLALGNPNNKKYIAARYELRSEIQEIKKENEKKQLIEKSLKGQFSEWDGSHRALEKIIKEGMNDPDSYEHVSTKYWIVGDHLIVLTKFRGKNAFGGIVTNSVKAKVSLDGSEINILEQN